VKFFRRGTSGAWFVPTIASTSAPTASEIIAGTDLGAAVTAIENFETTTSRISQPVLKYKVNPQIDGEQTFGDASMTLLEDNGVSGTDSAALQAAYTALADGATGFIVLSPKKQTPIAADKVEVWPVKVGANNRAWTMDNEMAKYQVAFAVTDVPVKNATVA